MAQNSSTAYTLQNSFNDIDLILASDIEVMQQRHEVQGKAAVHALYVNNNTTATSSSSPSASEDASQQLINKCTSPDCLARLIVYILELQGPMVASDVIRFLQVATGNDEIALVLRVHFQGLLQLLKSFKQLFRVSGDMSYNPLVSLSDEFVAQKNILRQRAHAELSCFFSHDQLTSQTLFSLSADDAEMSLRERTSSACTERVSELSISSIASPEEKCVPTLTARSTDERMSCIVLHPEALAHSIVCILEEKGPLKVGEVGKLLQVVVAPDGEINLAPIIKSQFKGLKKLIEGFRYLFWLDAAHPYNPTVHLTDEYHAASAAQNSVMLDSYFTFEPVNTMANAAMTALPVSTNYASGAACLHQKVNPPATAYYSAPKAAKPAPVTTTSAGKKQLQVSAPAFVMTNMSGGSCNGLLGKLQKQTSASSSRNRQMMNASATNNNRQFVPPQYYSSPQFNDQQYRYASSAHVQSSSALYGYEDVPMSADGSSLYHQRRFGTDASALDATCFDGSRIELYRDYFNPAASAYQQQMPLAASDQKPNAPPIYEEPSSDFAVAASPSSSSAEYSRVLKYLGI